jgi:hypothetical protein
MRVKSMGNAKYLQELAHKYMKEHRVDKIDLEDVARWAVKKHLYAPKPISVVQQCKREMAKALAIEYHTDPQGREVRSMIAFPVSSNAGQLQWEWAPLYLSTPEQFRLGMQTRRNGIRADCRQHKRDHDSYNDNNEHNAHVPLFDYDFNKDLERRHSQRSTPTDLRKKMKTILNPGPRTATPQHEGAA